MEACDERLKLALNRSVEVIDLEMDCAMAMSMILAYGKDKHKINHSYYKRRF
jgi:hypothetical protein